MANNLTKPHHTSSSQGSNIPNTSPPHILEFVMSSQHSIGQTFENSYEQIWDIRPITYMFAKAIGLIPGVHNLSYFLKMNVTTPNGITVSMVEDFFLTILKELAKTT